MTTERKGNLSSLLDTFFAVAVFLQDHFKATKISKYIFTKMYGDELFECLRVSAEETSPGPTEVCYSKHYKKLNI